MRFIDSTDLDGDGDLDGTDGNGNTYSYTGFESDPEVMEITTPASGTWKVGVYRQYEIGDVLYTLEANFNIVKSAGEVIPEQL